MRKSGLVYLFSFLMKVANVVVYKLVKRLRSDCSLKVGSCDMIDFGPRPEIRYA